MLEYIGNVINDTKMGDISSFETGVNFQTDLIQKMVESLNDIEYSKRNFTDNVQVLRHGFTSLKSWTIERVKDVDKKVQKLEERWTNQRQELLSGINELKGNVSKTNNILNAMQTDFENSVKALRIATSKSLQNTSKHCTAEIKKSEASIDDKFNKIDEAIEIIKGTIIPIYPVKNDDWLLVFRAKSGGFGGVFEAWETGTGARESFEPEDADFFFQEDDPYRNYAVDIWKRLRISLVHIALFDYDGQEVAFLLFDGMGSDKMNWFSKERLLDSSWVQLRYDSSLNYFSIAGDAGNKRRFFVNVRYQTCDIDHGFLVVIDRDAPRPCSYEKSLGQSMEILYSKFPGGTRWSSMEFRKAAYMDISIYRGNGHLRT